MQITQTRDRGLELRKAWLEKLNAVLGTDITVEPAEGWDAPAPVPAAEDEEEDEPVAD